MVVREIENRGGVRTVRMVDYKTGKVVAEGPNRERIADAWVNYRSLAMAARTPGHKKRLAAKLMAHGIAPDFDDQGFLRASSGKDQMKKAKIVLGPKTVNMNSWY